MAFIKFRADTILVHEKLHRRVSKGAMKLITNDRTQPHLLVIILNLDPQLLVIPQNPNTSNPDSPSTEP